jgi:hypothetical protein
MGQSFPPGLSDEKAARMMAALRDGRTLRKFGVKPPRLEAYFTAHPEYAQEARPLIEANTKAANLRKGAINGSKTHCIHGHSLADARVYYQNGWIKRDCRTCWKIRGQLGGIIKPEALAKVTAALQNGASVGQIISGKPIGGGPANRSLKIVDAAAFYRYRRENPEFDQFVASRIAGNNCRGQKIRHARARVRISRLIAEADAADYRAILAMVPSHFPAQNKFDVANSVVEDLLSFKIARSQVRDRVSFYVATFNRMYPSKYTKFGNSPLLSSDEALFDDGATTRGANISRGLWD